MSDKNKEMINHTIPITTSIAIIPMINSMSCIIAPIVLLFLYIIYSKIMKKFTNKFGKNHIEESIITNKDNTVKDVLKKPNGFCLLKPGFLEHENEFCDILNKNGWEILNKKKVLLTPDQASTLYINLEKEPFYNQLCDYMSSDDCICCTCINERSKDPIGDMKKIKECVREMWGKDKMKNAMHSSDSIDNVLRESKICFTNKSLKENVNNEFRDLIITQKITTGDELTNAPDGYLVALISKLKKAVAEEFATGYFYQMIRRFMFGINSYDIEKSFDGWWIEEMIEHTNILLDRLKQIDTLYPGDINPGNILSQCESNGHPWQQVKSMDTFDVCQTAIMMEHYAIETYRDLEFFTRNIDPVSTQLAKHLLSDELKHETLLNDYLDNITRQKCNINDINTLPTE